MTISVKRTVNIQVKVTESFKKNYILLINKLIDGISNQIESSKQAAKSLKDDLAFRPYIVNKINDALFKKEQLRQQLDTVKRCKEGELFDLSFHEGFVDLNVGDDVLKAISPIVVTVDGATITDIVS